MYIQSVCSTLIISLYCLNPSKSTLSRSSKSIPTPLDASEVAMVVKYLEACNRLFKRGILGHVRISTYPNKILDNMEGYAFFSKWLDSLLENG